MKKGHKLSHKKIKSLKKKEKDSTQMAKWPVVTAGESKRSQGSQKKENWNQPDEDGPHTVTLKLTRK